ncbi:MAG: hypothetical protein J4G04_03795 [Nitrosopumilaceae archaeon]|nr:hypothetical protein [Nitrosopumilaceae archaeon]
MTKRAYYLDSAIIVYGAILVVALGLFLFMIDLTLEEGLFDRLAPFITSVTVALAPFVYFLKTKHNENSERTRASRNLYTELNNTLGALDEKSHPDNFMVVEFEDGKKYYFMNRMLNHDFYDSLVFSGRINFLPTGIQQKTQDAFQLIKDHNSFIRSIRDIEDRAGPAEDVTPKTKRYYEALDRVEAELLAESGIPSLKAKLEKEFKIF